MSWFDNMGWPPTTGQLAEDGSLTFTTEYAYQGQKVKEQFLVARKDEAKLVFTARVQAPDGSWQPVMESVAAPPRRRCPSRPGRQPHRQRRGLTRRKPPHSESGGGCDGSTPRQ